MIKINWEKIVKAAVGSARLEGYKGPLQIAAEKIGGVARAEAKPKANTKR